MKPIVLSEELSISLVFFMKILQWTVLRTSGQPDDEVAGTILGPFTLDIFLSRNGIHPAS